MLSKYANKEVLKIAQLHHDHCFEEKLLDDIKNRYQNIDYFALLTDRLTAEVKDMLKGKNNHTQCLTIENFLEQTDNMADINSKEKTVVAVGRFHKVKGFDRLLEIWRNIVTQNPEWKLCLVGDGDEMQNLRDITQKLNIEDSVVFTGALSQPQVLETMKKASLFAMTSHSEGFPFVLIEAMSCALPVVAFDVRVGPGAIVENEINGLLIEDNDNTAFATAVCHLLTDDETRIKYSENALARAKCFSEEKIVEKWLTLFNS